MDSKNNDNDKQTRPATGTMQFGDDWPGVFVRGEQALYYAMQLGVLLERLPEKEKEKVGVTLLSSIEDLSKIFGSCFAPSGAPKDTQHIKAFVEAHVGKQKNQ
jgi:hypothetical protein